MSCGDDRRHEVTQKRERVLRFLERRQSDGLLLNRTDNFAWITAGGDNRISQTHAVGEAGLWIDADGMTLLASGSAVDRIDEEELEGLNVEIFAWPWYRDVAGEIQRFVGRRRVIADTTIGGYTDRGAEIATLRYALLPAEIERYRALGREAAAAVHTVAGTVKRGESELSVRERLAQTLIGSAIEPVTIHVASDDRMVQYRHPIPTAAEVLRSVFISQCARRGGLMVSLTRGLHFGDISHDLDGRHQAAVEVDAGLIAATRPGVTGLQLFDRLCELYAESGFPGRWESGEQGGAIGYSHPDWLACPTQSESVQPFQAFAWCPEITGTKSEDTVVVTDSDFEVITAAADDWPMRCINREGRVVERPDILRR